MKIKKNPRVVATEFGPLDLDLLAKQSAVLDNAVGYTQDWMRRENPLAYDDNWKTCMGTELIEALLGIQSLIDAMRDHYDPPENDTDGL